MNDLVVEPIESIPYYSPRHSSQVSLKLAKATGSVKAGEETRQRLMRQPS